MRPPRPQQAPTPFLRKWPRARRQLRGPSEYFETFRIEGAVSAWDVNNELQALAKSKIKPGWVAQMQGPPTIHQMLDVMRGRTVFAGKAKVKFIRQEAPCKTPK